MLRLFLMLATGLSCVSFSETVEIWEQFIGDVLSKSSEPHPKLSTVYIFCEVRTSICIGNTFLSRLPTAWMLLTDDYLVNSTTLNNISGRDHVVIAANNAEWAARLITHFKRGIDSWFTVILNVMQEESIVSSAALVTEAFWNINAVNIFIIPISSDISKGILRVYTLDPFRDAEHCFNTSPVQIGTSFYLKSIAHDRFSRNRFKNLNRCKLKVSTFPGYGIDLTKGKDGSWVVTGPAANILYTVARKMNFTPVIVPVEDGELWGYANNASSAGLRGAVHINEVDLSFQMVFHQDMDFFDYDDNLKADCLGFCLPLRKAHESVWWHLINEFKTDVWCLLLATLVIVCCLIKFLARFSFLDYALETSTTLTMIGVLLSSSTVTPQSFPGRLFFAHFFLFCIVITTAYRAAQKSMYMAPPTAKDVETISDLAASDLQITIFQSSQEYVADFPPELAPNVVYISDSDYDVYYENFQKGRLGVLTTSTICDIYSHTGSAKNYTRFHTYMLPNFCVKVMPWHFFMLPKLSPLTRALYVTTTRLVEHGFIVKFQREMESHGDLGGRHPKDGIFDMGYFCSAFFMLLAGISLAFSVFLLEICANRKNGMFRRG